MTASDVKQFVAAIDRVGRSRGRHERFSDFLELAYCATAKTTFAPGAEADALEERYMQVVGRYPANEIHAMADLFAQLLIALAGGGCDFLGDVAGELGLLDARAGQFFTPYPVARMMAEMALVSAGDTVAERGFITLQEPACGAGCMAIAAADVLAARGHDIGQNCVPDL